MNKTQKQDAREAVGQILKGTGVLSGGLLLIAALGYGIYAMMGGLPPG